jgi:putative ABC transport system substrate-binding protein
MRFARLTVLAPLALAFLAAPLAASAQAPQRVFRIGVLTVWPRPPDVTTYAPGFVREMLALGWVEGQHYVREYRFADGRARLPALAAELVALPVDLILAVSTPAAQAVKAATTTLPIVFQVGSNPIPRGLVATYAHPGGNLTGYTDEGIYEEKQLQLLKEVVPRMSRVGVLSRCLESQISAEAARTLGVQVRCIKVEDAKGLPGARPFS